MIIQFLFLGNKLYILYIITYMTKQVNGPVNAIRLEGSINDINKIVYLFGDIHMPIQFQRKCEDPTSMDIHTYMARQLKKVDPKDTYDFFFEVRPSYLVVDRSKNKKSYMNEIDDLFRHAFRMENNKVKPSDQFPNIRMHYIDIRDYAWNTDAGIGQSRNIGQLQKIIYYEINESYIYKNDILHMKQIIQTELDYIHDIYDIIYGSAGPTITKRATTIKGGALAQPVDPNKPDDAIVSNIDPATKNTKLAKILNKILNKYTNPSVSKIMHNIIDHDLKHKFEMFYDYAAKFNDELDLIQKSVDTMPDVRVDSDGTFIFGMTPSEIIKMISNLMYLYEKLDGSHLTLYSNIMDLYFIRRMCDKPYITNSIVYSGYYHTINYIYMLVKYFGFKVTNYGYIDKSITNADNLNKVIKASDYQYKLEPLFTQNKIVQCVDLSTFPDHFK